MNNFLLDSQARDADTRLEPESQERMPFAWGDWIQEEYCTGSYLVLYRINLKLTRTVCVLYSYSILSYLLIYYSQTIELPIALGDWMGIRYLLFDLYLKFLSVYDNQYARAFYSSKVHTGPTKLC